MIIGIDGNEANIKNRVGIGHFAYNLILGLNKTDKKNHYVIYLKETPLPDLPPPSPNWQYRVFGPGKLWTIFALPFHLYFDRQHLDLFFSPSHYLPRFCPFKSVCSIMDLGFLHYPNQFTKKDLYQLVNWTRQSVKQASKVVAISQFTKNEIMSIYRLKAQQVSIISPGASPPPDPSLDIIKSVLSKYLGQKSNYFLYIGTLKPNKNLPLLFEAFAAYLQQKHLVSTLIIAGKKGWLYDDIFKTVTKLKLEKSVVFTDYITETEKWVLLKRATSLIIPSLYEGFGIPALESMAVGTPVIAANITSLPEIIGPAGILVDPTSSQQLSSAMHQMDSDEVRLKYSQLGRQRCRLFTWDKAAHSLINVFNSIT